MESLNTDEAVAMVHAHVAEAKRSLVAACEAIGLTAEHRKRLNPQIQERINTLFNLAADARDAAKALSEDQSRWGVYSPDN